MADIHGISLIISKKCSLGWFKPGYFFDDNPGFGFKIDIMFGWIIRPMANLYKLWTDKRAIRDIPQADWPDFFGKKKAFQISHLYSTRWKAQAYNPWYGKYLFVFRLPRWIPSGAITIGTPWKFLFLGMKAYTVDPPMSWGMPSPDEITGRDRVWTNEKDWKRSMKEKPFYKYEALCPSATLRSVKKKASAKR